MTSDSTGGIKSEVIKTPPKPPAPGQGPSINSAIQIGQLSQLSSALSENKKTGEDLPVSNRASPAPPKPILTSFEKTIHDEHKRDMDALIKAKASAEQIAAMQAKIDRERELMAGVRESHSPSPNKP